MLRNGRDWCAALQQSHTAHPSLVYFRSTGVGASWPAALGILLDTALMLELLVHEPSAHAAAALLTDEGATAVEAIAKLLRVAPQPPRTSVEEFARLASRLAAAGYELQPGGAERFVAQRAKYLACIDALAAHLGVRSVELLPD